MSNLLNKRQLCDICHKRNTLTTVNPCHNPECKLTVHPDCLQQRVARYNQHDRCYLCPRCDSNIKIIKYEYDTEKIITNYAHILFATFLVIAYPFIMYILCQKLYDNGKIIDNQNVLSFLRFFTSLVGFIVQIWLIIMSPVVIYCNIDNSGKWFPKMFDKHCTFIVLIGLNVLIYIFLALVGGIGNLPENNYELVFSLNTLTYGLVYSVIIALTSCVIVGAIIGLIVLNKYIVDKHTTLIVR